MATIGKFRHWYEQERDSNNKMLDMIESVPEASRLDKRFQQAVNLAAHLAACRENWLDRMESNGTSQVEWFEAEADPKSLRNRFAAIESRWIKYLANLDDIDMDDDFEFPLRDGRRYRWSIEGQLVQLFGHAFYHRGQVSLLVDQLGGETVDTDYLFWETQQNARYGFID